MTLALIARVIHGDHQWPVIRPRPGKNQETIMRPVALPAGRTLQHLPLAVAENGFPQKCQQAVVELMQALIDRLVRPAYKMRRNAFLAAFELSLVKKPQ